MSARIGSGGTAVRARFAAKPTLVAPDNPAAGRLNPFADGLYTNWVADERAPEDLIAGLRLARTGSTFGEVSAWVSQAASKAFPDNAAHAGEAVLAFIDSGALFVAYRAAFGTVRALEDMLAAATTRAEAAEAALAAFVAGTQVFVGDAAAMAALVANLGPWLRAVQGGTYVPHALPNQAGQAAEGLDAAGAVMAAALAALREVLARPPTVVEEAAVDTAPVAEAGGTMVVATAAEATSAQLVPQEWVDEAVARFENAEHLPTFQSVPAGIRALLVAQSAKRAAVDKQVFFKRARQKLSDFERETLQSLTNRVTEKLPELTSEEVEVVWAFLYGRIEVYLRGEMSNPRDRSLRLAPRVSDMHRQFDHWIGLAAGALQHFRARQVVALPLPSGTALDDATETVVAKPAVTAPTAAAMAGGGEGGQESGQPMPEVIADSDAIVAEITRRDRAEMTRRVDEILRKVQNLRDQIDGDDADATVLRLQLNAIGEGVQLQRTLINIATGEEWTDIVDAVIKAEGDFTAAKALAAENRMLSGQPLPARDLHPGSSHTRCGARDGEHWLAVKSRGGHWSEIPGVSLAHAELEKKLPEKWRKKMIDILNGAPAGLQDPQGAWRRSNGVHALQNVKNFYAIRVTETSPGYRLLVYRSTDGTVHVRFAGSHAGYDKVCGLNHISTLHTWGKARDSK